MIITQGTKFIVPPADPEFYFNQANAELFPRHSNKSKRQQHALWAACDTQPVDRGPEPEVGPELNHAQVELCKRVATDIEDYFNSCKPTSSAVFIFLACESLPMGIFWTVDNAEHAYNKLLVRGAGIYDYLALKMIDQTHVDPRLAVLRLAHDCERYNLRSLRMPTGNGQDVMFSLDPITTYPQFDNVKYIPATCGYYGIVAKGGRDE